MFFIHLLLIITNISVKRLMEYTAMVLSNGSLYNF